MSRKTTGTAGGTRRRVAVGTALLGTTALVGASLALAAGGTTFNVTSFGVYGAAANATPAGPMHGGNTVLVVTGTGLSTVRHAWFGGVEGHVLPESDTTVYVTPPAAATAGAVAVVLGDKDDTATNGGYTVGGSGATDYTYTAAPAITGVHVDSTNKKLVDVVGTQLTGATAVLFGDTLVKLSKTATVTDTQITMAAPSLKSGLVDVAVVSPNGIGSKAGAFGAAPKISKVVWAGDTAKSPKNVQTAAAATGTVATGDSATSTVGRMTSATGTVVLVTGTGFSGLTSVTFGKATAYAVVVNDSTLRVRIPAMDSGDVIDGKTGLAKVAVVAHNAFGDSPAFKFAYYNPVTLTSLSVVNGTANKATNTVTLTGSSLTGVRVTFGTKGAKVAAGGTDSSVTVAPAKDVAGTVDVKVTVPNGSFFILPKAYTFQ